MNKKWENKIEDEKNISFKGNRTWVASVED